MPEAAPPLHIASTASMTLVAPSTTMTLFPPSKADRHAMPTPDIRDGERFLRELETLFDVPLDLKNLSAISRRFLHQFQSRLRRSASCMLPNHNYTLPRGDEQGTYLALDVGGSTLRVALVRLAGRHGHHQPVRIVRMDNFEIDTVVKSLVGHAFFDWMAGRICDMLGRGDEYNMSSAALPVAMAWSFPVDQTSSRGGGICRMGKGFFACHGVLGQDLRDLVTLACRRKGLNVRMDAIINDAAATLLSRAYIDDAARIAVVVGTGINAAVHLPTSAFGPDSFKLRRPVKTTHLLVNTELSMFGEDVFSRNRWDDFINVTSDQPDFQPFEQVVGGRYLGETVRLILTEAVHTTGLFAIGRPIKLDEPFSLDTAMIASIECDDTPNLQHTGEVFRTQYPCSAPPSQTDLLFVRRVCQLVSRRAAGYLAAAIHALWALGNEAEHLKPSAAGRVSIGCNGSVIEKYPAFKSTCQHYLDGLTELSGGMPHSVVLEPAVKSAVLGAAIAISCTNKDGV